MKYSKDEVVQYAREEDVKFIRLAFCDVFGRQKNIAVMPDELPRAFEHGISFDASAIAGFGDETRSDLMLHPEPETLIPLPWRPEHGRVVQMYSSIAYPDGSPFPCDTRALLKRADLEAKRAGFEFTFGAEQEFYLFNLDEDGRPTCVPCDTAGYMDIAPEDRGENVRREVCLTLEQMGIRPESSHHEEGPGQNEIVFRYADAVTAADSAQTFRRAVKTVAHRNGLYADFSPKPVEDAPGNGFHINISLRPFDGGEVFSQMIAGILANAGAMTAFLNPCEESYRRLGRCKAPGYVSWSHENRSQLVRIPAAAGEYRRAELRSPDPEANPYLAFTLMIYAGLYGIKNRLTLCPPADVNLYTAGTEALSGYEALPKDLAGARERAASSEFVKAYIPSEILKIYCAE
ncbi:MAG: glutamine synthetase [Oscillospiraceae bacterium]|nr:glutamine synthetase [Oscillospiraceae bacterium]